MGHNDGFPIERHYRVDEVSTMSFDAYQSYGGHSSVGSNNSTTPMLGVEPNNDSNPNLMRNTSKKSRHRLTDDALSNALFDDGSCVEGIRGYENWVIDLSRLTLGPAFAQGAFGRLYKGTYASGKDVGVKILERPPNNPLRAQMLENQFSKEVAMLATLKHENVVQFVGYCRKPLVWCIVTEYAKGGSLRAFLVKRRAISLRLSMKYALEIARGMAYLHSFGVIHRDLKSDNLLMVDNSIKIADFGAARIESQDEIMTPETGTYAWMAPEMIQHRPYNNKIDVYSFGIVLWELITGNLPFQNMSGVQMVSAVLNGVRPEVPPNIPPTLAYIMTHCWDSNPDVRPPFSEIIQLLEVAQEVVLRTVGTAKFRGCGCIALSPTLD